MLWKQENCILLIFGSLVLFDDCCGKFVLGAWMFFCRNPILNLYELTVEWFGWGSIVFRMHFLDCLTLWCSIVYTYYIRKGFFEVYSTLTEFVLFILFRKGSKSWDSEEWVEILRPLPCKFDYLFIVCLLGQHKFKNKMFIHDFELELIHHAMKTWQSLVMLWFIFYFSGLE